MATELSIVTEHLAPFQIVSEYAVGGFSTEIVETVLKASGYQYLLEAHPWSTTYHKAKHLENTCIYSLAFTPARKAKFRWVGHITKSSSSFYSMASNPIKISQLNEAKKYNTAVIKDDVTHQFLLNKGFVENDNLYVMDSYDSILKLLATPGRHIDLVVVNNSLIEYLSGKIGTAAKYKNVYMLKDLSLDFYFACSLQTKQSVVDDIKQTMARLEQGGTLSKIRQKWQTNMQ
ncbi:MAG: transporter substrate-binding domain-containing protein [Paraglaciecola sp.]|nr:transporter substrate-binding domain-containing protein [Paraglaciecola sp.]